jgi:hypothetical protein
VFRIETHINSWLFRPLMVAKRLPPEFYEAVDYLISKYNYSWWCMLNNRPVITALTALYDRFIGKQSRNSHSLLLRHYPEQKGISISSKIHCVNGQCSYGVKGLTTCPLQCGYSSTATVLLGDLKLSKKAKTVINKNKFIEDNTGTILIPHHGADSSDLIWLDDKLDKTNDLSSMVVSYGTKNIYRHPKFMRDGTINMVKNPIILVNENLPYKYRIIVDDND